MQRSTVFTVAGVLLAITTLASSARASGTEIGVDVDGALPVNTSLLNGGGGFGIRLGEEFHVPLLRLTPEVDYGYMHLFASQAPSDWTTNRIQGGLRHGPGERVVPSRSCTWATAGARPPIARTEAAVWRSTPGWDWTSTWESFPSVLTPATR